MRETFPSCSPDDERGRGRGQGISTAEAETDLGCYALFAAFHPPCAYDLLRGEHTFLPAMISTSNALTLYDQSSAPHVFRPSFFAFQTLNRRDVYGTCMALRGSNIFLNSSAGAYPFPYPSEAPITAFSHLYSGSCHLFRMLAAALLRISACLASKASRSTD